MPAKGQEYKPPHSPHARDRRYLSLTCDRDLIAATAGEPSWTVSLDFVRAYRFDRPAGRPDFTPSPPASCSRAILRRRHRRGGALPTLVYMSGLASLLAGLAIVNAYAAWTGDWRVVVTAVGWILVIAGIVRIHPQARDHARDHDLFRAHRRRRSPP